MILKNKERRRYKDCRGWGEGNKQLLFADDTTECGSKKIYRKIIRVNRAFSKITENKNYEKSFAFLYTSHKN